MSIRKFPIIHYFVILLITIACSRNTKNLDITNESEFNSDSLVISNNKNNYIIGDSLITFCLKNNTSGIISYGSDYDIEYFDSISNSWNSIVFSEDIIFTLQNINLYTGGTDTIKIYLYPKLHNYQPGKYRVSKNICIGSSSNATKVYLNFDLTD